MPREKLVVGLKLVKFFMGNPGLDVEPSTQEVNKSVMYEGEANDVPFCCRTARI